MRRSPVLPLAAAIALGAVAPAQAGTYDVRACATPYGTYANKSWMLQAFDRGHWRTFATTRSRKNGHVSRAYRFTRTSSRRTYRFRARLPREAAYPYSTGNSRTVRVRVG